MILFEDDQGLCFWPEELIASVTPAFPNRFRIVTADGTVGYSPSAEPFVNAQWCGSGADPAGFPQELIAAVTPSQYVQEPFWAVQRTANGWLRHLDQSTSAGSAEDLEGLVQCADDWYFQPRRLRRVGNPALLLTFDQGRTIKVAPAFHDVVKAALGITSLQLLPEGLTRTFLREYPFEIARAPAEVLKRHFQTARQLVANLLWQALFYRRLGLDKGYGITHRGFWYNPLYATLERAGLIELPDDLRLDKAGAEAMYANVLGQMIERDRLFCYRDLGFADSHSQDREIGARRPEVILLIEKESLSAAGIAAARHHGISWIVTGGISRLVAVEYFCAALQSVYGGEVVVLVLGDFDPGGWLTGHTFVVHLARYGVFCPAGPVFLVRPEVFSEEELRLFSRPLSAKDGRVEEWLAASGGIAGEARGIHADWLQPAERVLRVLEASLPE